LFYRESKKLSQDIKDIESARKRMAHHDPEAITMPKKLLPHLLNFGARFVKKSLFSSSYVKLSLL